MKKFLIIFSTFFLISAGWSCGKGRGDTYLEYEVMFPSSASGPEKETMMKRSVEVIWKRLDKIGIEGASVKMIGENHIEVGLPPAQDLDRTIAILKRPGKLEFKMVDESMPDPQVLSLVESTRSTQNISVGSSHEAVAQLNKALQGKIPVDDEIAFEIQYDELTKKITKETPYLFKSQVAVSGEMLNNAKVSISNGIPHISLQFDETGTKALENLTSQNIGKRLAILIDGEVIIAPVIHEAITKGSAQITMGYRKDYSTMLHDAEDLTTVLSSGPLSANITLREIKKSP